MFPCKNMMDYNTEMNKLFSFSRTSENVLQTPYRMAQSPFNQSTNNRSSSSTDSTSPESLHCPELTPFPEYRPDFTRNVCETVRPIYDTPRMYDSPRQLFESPRVNEPPRFLESPRVYESARTFPESPRVYETRSFHESPRRVQETPRLMQEFSKLDSRPICETPRPESQVILRRQRPIVGRKFQISDNFVENPVQRIPEDFEFPQSIWHEDGQFQRTPPNPTFLEPKHSGNVYELFPVENRGYEFKTPVKTSPTYSVSPSVSNTSPSFSLSPNKIFPNQNNFSPPNSMALRPRNISPAPSTSSYQDIRPGKMCTFCRKNGETPIVYMTHWVRERVGNKSIVTCPILRSHVCSTCGLTGDDAHTITYCPILRSTNNGLPLQSTTITLKNTRIKSNGRRRY